MTNCVYCNAIKKGIDPIYEDNLCVGVLVKKPATPGHIVLLPKEHYPIMEQVPEDVMSHLFIVSNKLAISAFEGLKAEGSNLIIQNGVAAGQSHSHFLINLIPRKQGDDVDFAWQPKQLPEEQIAQVQSMIMQQLSVPISTTDSTVSDAEAYLLEQLERLP